MTEAAITNELNSTSVTSLLPLNSTDVEANNVTLTSTLTTILSTSTSLPSTISTTNTVPTSVTELVTSTVISTTTEAVSTSSSGLIFFSFIVFIVASALIGKIIISNRKKRSDLIGGSARWRLAASQQSGSGPTRTAASYAPMDTRRPGAPGGLDAPGPDRNLDWERQFFDDSEPVEPSRLRFEFGQERV